MLDIKSLELVRGKFPPRPEGLHPPECIGEAKNTRDLLDMMIDSGDTVALGGGSMVPNTAKTDYTSVRIIAIARRERHPVKLIHKLGYESVDLVGVSWGGFLAMVMAAEYPGVVRKLVLLSTTAEPWKQLTEPERRDALMHKKYGGRVQTDPKLLAELNAVKKSARTTDWYRAHALLLSADCYAGYSRLNEITQQTLILVGDADPITPVVQAQHLLRIPHSKLIVIKDEGHVMGFTSADVVAGEINRFLHETI